MSEMGDNCGLFLMSEMGDNCGLFFMSKVGNICMGVTKVRDWIIGCVTQVTGRSNLLVSYLR